MVLVESISLAKNAAAFLRMRFPFSFPPVLCAACGFPHRCLSFLFILGSFRILRGMPTPIYGQSPNRYSSFQLLIVRPSSKYKRTIFFLNLGS